MLAICDGEPNAEPAPDTMMAKRSASFEVNTKIVRLDVDNPPGDGKVDDVACENGSNIQLERPQIGCEILLRISAFEEATNRVLQAMYVFPSVFD